MQPAAAWSVSQRFFPLWRQRVKGVAPFRKLGAILVRFPRRFDEPESQKVVNGKFFSGQRRVDVDDGENAEMTAKEQGDVEDDGDGDHETDVSWDVGTLQQRGGILVEHLLHFTALGTLPSQ